MRDSMTSRLPWLKMSIVVGEQDVDAVDAETFQRKLERPHDAVVGVVEMLPPVGRVEELADAGALFRLQTSSRRPALVDSTYSSRGLPRRNRFTRVSASPSP